jgi:hypothetical protein
MWTRKFPDMPEILVGPDVTCRLWLGRLSWPPNEPHERRYLSDAIYLGR